MTRAEWKEHITSLYPVYDKMPEGWKITEGALTAPVGYAWIDNNKGFYTHRGERRQALLKLQKEA